ncbi:MAG: class I tRNA ligase family protein [Saprospiraceae bacterium]
MNDLRQDEDVLDTWASSWLWPISVFNGFEDPEGEFKYYYPTNVLVTGWDIIFFWVARMIMAGFEFKGEKPFQAVYFTGMVRDSQRRKMSKSLGNSPDALKLIESFGADGVRYGLMSSAAAGGDILFEDKLCENGRNFCNKLWNALRLVKGWSVTESAENEETAIKNKLAISWFRNKFQQVLSSINHDFSQYRLSEALLTLYTFIWDDFCSWYLEMIKPGYEQPIDRETYEATLDIFGELMITLHPFMPFVTEEIWHNLKTRSEGDDCCAQKWLSVKKSDTTMIANVEKAKEVISKVRDLRNQNQIKPKEPLELYVQDSASANSLFEQQGLKELVMKLAVLKGLSISKEEPENAKSFISGTEKYYVALNQEIDVAAECEKLQKELDYQKGFLKSVQGKLSNERFVAGAPAQVVDNERKKLADAQARIAILEESISKLGC